EQEKSYVDYLKELGLLFRTSKVSMEKAEAFDWINTNREKLEERGFRAVQNSNDKGERYFLRTASIAVEVTANIDWFDVNAVIEFGPYEIPFSKIRRMVLFGKSEFELPNGEIAMIPRSWFVDYAEIFSFLED